MSTNDDIKRDSNKIWLAGLGAYACREQGKDDSFDQLIEKGRSFEKKHQTQQSSEAAEARLIDLRSRANQTMDRIEKAFDMRVSSTLGRLGISHKSEIEALNNKVDQLSLALDRLCDELNREKSE